MFQEAAEENTENRINWFFITLLIYKKIWEVDPLECPKCGREMKIISFITESAVIRQILEHLNLWTERLARDTARKQA